MNYSPNHPAVRHYNQIHGTRLGYAPRMGYRNGARILAAWAIMAATLTTVGELGPIGVIIGAGLFVWVMRPYLRRED